MWGRGIQGERKIKLFVEMVLKRIRKSGSFPSHVTCCKKGNVRRGFLFLQD